MKKLLVGLSLVLSCNLFADAKLSYNVASWMYVPGSKTCVKLNQNQFTDLYVNLVKENFPFYESLTIDDNVNGKIIPKYTWIFGLPISSTQVAVSHISTDQGTCEYVKKEIFKNENVVKSLR